jgi:hypothetical protein
MAENLGSAILELRTTDAGLVRGIDQAQRSAQGLDRQFTRSASSIGNSLRTLVSGPIAQLGSAVAGAFAVRALVGFTTSIINTADELSKMSQRVGISVEALSVLAHEADLSDASVQDLTIALRAMQVNVAEAARGAGEAAGVLHAMGFSVDELRRAASDPEGFLQEFARRLFEIREVGQRTEAAFRVLGRSSINLIPLLQNLANQGMAGLTRQAEAANAVIGADFAASAEAFNDSLTKIGAQLASTVRSVIGPAIQAFFSLSETVRTVLDQLGLVGKTAVEHLAAQEETLLVRRELLQQELGVQELGNFPFGRGDPTQIAQDIADINRQLEVTHQQMVKLAKQDLLAITPEKPQPTGGGRVLDFDALDKRRKASADAHKASTDAQKAAQKDLEDFITASNARLKQSDEERAQALVAVFEQTRTPLEAFIAEVERLQGLQGLDPEILGRAVGQLANSFAQGTEAFKAWNAELARGAQLTEQLRTPTEAFNDTIRELAGLLQSTAISQETFDRGVKAAVETFNEVGQSTSRASDAARELGLTFTSAFEDAIINLKSLSDVAKGFLEDLTRALLRLAIIQPLLQGLVGTSDAPGLLTSGFKSLFGAQHGGLFKVAGSGGVDSQFVGLMATPGEHVWVTPPGAPTGGEGYGKVVINNYSSSQVSTRERRGTRGERQLEIVVDEMVAKSLTRPGSASGKVLRNPPGLIGR